MREQGSSRPISPKNAASLIVLRGRGEDSEVLLGRRNAKHRFMPSVYVFPGGRVDAEDQHAPIDRGLKASTETILTPKWGSGMARALVTAALRETYEETGLRFGEGDGDDFRPDLSCVDYVGRAITPPASPIRFHARFFLAHEEDSHGTPSDSHELEDLQWVPISRALELPLIDVTEFMLLTVRRRLQGGSLKGYPFFRYLRGEPRIRYE